MRDPLHPSPTPKHLHGKDRLTLLPPSSSSLLYEVLYRVAVLPFLTVCGYVSSTPQSFKQLDNQIRYVNGLVPTVLKIDIQPENRRVFYAYTDRYFAREMETNT
jgi:hypothetical protein